VWTKNPLAEKQSNINYYMADPEVRKASWKSRLEHTRGRRAEPGASPRLPCSRTAPKLHALITQNIDELHQMAAIRRQVIEVHGTMRKVVCMSCAMTAPMQKALDRCGRASGPAVSRLRGILKSATISFGQALGAGGDRGAMRAAAEADLFFAIGSSLQVYPIAGVVPLARDAGAKV